MTETGIQSGLSPYDRERLGRVLHRVVHQQDAYRVGDGNRININGAHFDFPAFMETLRELIPDPDQS